MELIENLLQLLVTFVGALLSGIFYWKSRRQADFLLLCFYRFRKRAVRLDSWAVFLAAFAVVSAVFPAWAVDRKSVV